LIFILREILDLSLHGLICLMRIQGGKLVEVSGSSPVDKGKLVRLVEILENGSARGSERIRSLGRPVGMSVILDDLGVLVIGDYVALVHAREVNWSELVKQMRRVIVNG